MTYAQMTLGTVDLEERRYEDAIERFLSSLKVALDVGDRTLLVHLLEGCAGLASALGQHQRAIRLGGAAAALREAAGALPAQRGSTSPSGTWPLRVRRWVTRPPPLPWRQAGACPPDERSRKPKS